jgi:TrmH family RNA methyltransferase
LDKKRYRQETGLFLAEGNKLVSDLLPYFECESLFAKPEWIASRGKITAKEIVEVSEEEIERAGLLKKTRDVIGIFVQPKMVLEKETLSDELSLILDGIQDPGNAGTIIRIADWFGIKNVICSPDTVDIYNPKTIQATMGSIARVKVFYAELVQLLAELEHIPVYGTFLEGNNMYTENLGSTGFIVMGNEGNGIRNELKNRIHHRIHIPGFPSGGETSESLNVAVATAVVCAEFRRRQVYSVQ